MEKSRSRYIILGLSDGLFLGLGISLGISFFHNYQLTFASILLVGISGSLSNFFSTYNAENFVLGQQIKEYGRVLFARDYNPNKMTRMKKFKNLIYAEVSFLSTLLGSFIVLIPYIIYSIIGISRNFSDSIISLALSLAILAYLGGYHIEKKADRIKDGLKTAGVGLLIAGVSAITGILINIFI
jgi:predicted membrane protein (TIGR00267 family)